VIVIYKMSCDEFCCDDEVEDNMLAMEVEVETAEILLPQSDKSSVEPLTCAICNAETGERAQEISRGLDNFVYVSSDWSFTFS
jgi:hypothetical protein